MDLIVRQGKEVGLSAADVMNAAPLPTTKAAMYAWFWIARTRRMAGSHRRVDHRRVDQ
jgi:hypothetical protein